MTKLSALALVASALTIGACVNGTQVLDGPSVAISADIGQPKAGANQHAISGTVASMVKPYHTIEQAHVEITQGADAGRVVDSDAAGAFQLTGIAAGTIALTITKEGYQPWQGTVLLNSDQTLDAKLMPIAP